MQIYKYNGWRLLSFISEHKAKKFFDLVQEEKYATVSILKKDKRSKVLRFSFEDKDYILKVPLEKNYSKWIRFTTLYREGESFKSQYSIHELNQMQLSAAQPILAAEKRRFGMVVDSWFIYNYLDGESCLNNEDYYPQVINSLQNLHEKGFLHGDPQIRNFIVSKDKRIHIIDAKLSRAYFSLFSKNYEWAYLAKSAPGIEKYFQFQNKFGFKITKTADWVYRRFVIVKRKIFKIVKAPFR